MAGGPKAGGIATNPNINQMAAQGIKGAGLGTISGMNYQPGQLATTKLSPYMNPYTTDVIKANEADILRGGTMLSNELNAQASAAKAFGGSRHGIATGEMGRNIVEQLAQSSAGLRQQGFQNAQQQAQTDIQNRLQGAQHRLTSSGQLSNISNLGFGMGQTVTQNLAQQGAQKQALQQSLIDIAKQRYGEYTNHPVQGLGYATQALGAAPVPQTETKTKSPGLFDYLTLAASTYAKTSDKRLKTNITKMGQLKSGLNIYKWDWKEGAEKFGADMNHTVGVIAQEVKDLFPNAVVKMDNGYYAVKYGELR
jgi:hypothetical protein